MDKRIKYGQKQKVSTVRSVISGRETILLAARRLACRENTIVRWVRQYKQHGGKGLQVRNGSYTGRFKVRVVCYMLRKGLSLMATAIHFNIPSESAVYRWVKTYERQGSAGLLKETRGRKKTFMPPKTKKKTAEAANTPEEKLAALQKEVEYLRAENAFLKKLDALIQQGKAEKEQSRRPKPSRN